MYCTNKKQKPIFVCPVCNESGPNTTSLSHWVRSEHGSVICPTLSGQRCGECGENGHTTKKCLEMKRELRDKRRRQYQAQQQQPEQNFSAVHQSTGVQIRRYGAYGAESKREEELRRIISDVKKKPEVINEKDRQIVRVFNSF